MPEAERQPALIVCSVCSEPRSVIYFGSHSDVCWECHTANVRNARIAWRIPEEHREARRRDEHRPLRVTTLPPMPRPRLPVRPKLRKSA